MQVINAHVTVLSLLLLSAASAVIFFVLEDFLLVHITLQGVGSLTKISVIVKTICTLIACFSTTVRRILLHFSLRSMILMDIPLEHLS